MRPPLGIDTVKGALCIDVGLTIIEGKGKKRRENGDMKRGALIWWSGLSCLPLLGWKKVTRQNPDQWLRQWDNHLSGHCAQSGGLDLTWAFPHYERGRTACVKRGVMWPQWPVRAEQWFPSSAHMITAGWWFIQSHSRGHWSNDMAVMQFENSLKY